MLDPRLLATFREVAVRRSFSAAAAALNLTQPAVSQHVSRLEKTLGARLLERDARGVHVTAPGEALLRHSDTILEGLRRAEADVRAASGQERAPLKVGAFSTVAAGLLPAATRELRATAPDLRFDLCIIEPDAATEEIRAGRLDVAMTTEDQFRPILSDGSVEAVPILEDPMVLALSPEHRLASQGAIDIADLADEDWLLTCLGGTCADSNIVFSACRAAGFQPRVRAELDDYTALMGMAAAGLGVALVPSLALHGTRPDVVLRPLTGRPPIRYLLAVIRRERRADVDAFVEALRAAARPRLSAVA